MSEKVDEIMEKLQAPFDDELMRWVGVRYREDEERAFFGESVYSQRLDEVLGFNWQSEMDGSSCKITVQLPDGTKITRMGENFREACEMFGVGRYVHNIPRRKKQRAY